MLCAWTLMHVHNFNFQVVNRSYPVDSCCVTDNEGMKATSVSIAFFLTGSSHFALVYIVF